MKSNLELLEIWVKTDAQQMKLDEGWYHLTDEEMRRSRELIKDFYFALGLNANTDRYTPINQEIKNKVYEYFKKIYKK